MIHFGKKIIQRAVKFTDSCYYPIVVDDDWNINRLFGLSFGIFAEFRNSINVGWRPSETKIDKIDLFAVTYKNKRREVNFFSSIDTKESYVIKIKLDNEHPIAAFQIFNIDNGNKIANFMTYFKLPIVRYGYVLNPRIENKLRKNSEIWLNKISCEYK